MSLSDYRHIISRLHVIIRVSKHYQHTLCHYESIVTLSAEFPCRYQSIVTLSAISISLSEYRKIIRSLHATVRISSHYWQPTFHYQTIVTLSAETIPLSEYRNIIGSLHAIIRLSSHHQTSPYHYQKIVTLSAD
jgi:hypothetical protein